MFRFRDGVSRCGSGEDFFHLSVKLHQEIHIGINETRRAWDGGGGWTDDGDDGGVAAVGGAPSIRLSAPLGD